MCAGLLAVCGALLVWLSILDPILGPFVDCISWILGCRLLLMHIDGVVWDLLKGESYAFVDV